MLAVSLQFRFKARPFEHITIDNAARDPALLHLKNGANISSTIAGKALVGPA